MSKIKIKRIKKILTPTHERVLIRPFRPTDESRYFKIIGRIMSLTEEEANQKLKDVFKEFKDRHKSIRQIFMNTYENIKKWSFTDKAISNNRKELIGAYFTQEYSLEAAALFNPSIVLHPDQSNLPENNIRFILSLRATGEGHISSIVFREGIITESFDIQIKEPSPYVNEPVKILNQYYKKEFFIRKLNEINLYNNFSKMILSELSDSFSIDELYEKVNYYKQKHPNKDEINNTADSIMTFVDSNYEVTFSPEQETSEKAIFPSSPSQKNGIEDGRLVRFVDDEKIKYYCTYTAFDGKTIFPQLFETDDFVKFKFITLNGPEATNKGMALFPKKINGKFAMISRQDNENIYIMFSDNLHSWYTSQIILRPSYPWEFIQLGNCGSPIETEYGWLVLSHGVGPIRKYCIGAFLLDKNDPSKVIGRLKEPLLEPNENEREGYVPNVVYTCGALLNNKKLIIPYAMSDYASSFAICDIDDIFSNMHYL